MPRPKDSYHTGLKTWRLTNQEYWQSAAIYFDEVIMARHQETAYVFLDTNILMEFQHFTQIDWLKILNYQTVCLVLAPVVVSELEAFKYDQRSQRRQSRSRKLTKDINELVFSAPAGEPVPIPQRPGVTLLALIDSAKVGAYPSLDPMLKDDQLLASVLYYKEQASDTHKEHVWFIADDGGLLNKARSRGILFKRLDEDLRLQPELNEEQKEINRLKRELQEIQNRSPKLLLGKKDNDEIQNRMEVNITVLKPLRREEFDLIIEKESRATLLTEQDQERIADNIRMAMGTSVNPSKREIYEKNRETYLEELKKYIRNICTHHHRIARSKALDLHIYNDGTLPASQLVITLSIPGDFNVSYGLKRTAELEKPKRPRIPTDRGRARYLSDVMRDMSSDSVNAGYGNIDVAPRTVFFQREGGVWKIRWEVENIQHSAFRRLPPVELIYPSIESQKTYELPFTIIANEIPKPLNGFLFISVTPESAVLNIEEMEEFQTYLK